MKPLYVGRPNLPDKRVFLQYVEGIWERNWLTNDGPLVQQFEQEVSDLLGVRNVIAVSNATVGLELSIRALELSGEVIVPSFTFIATAHVLALAGLKPVFCDIDPNTWCIDPNKVASLITDRTSAILGVHLFGHPCDSVGLDASGLPIFYDAAHAFNCSGVGYLGELEVFSFHATKFINCFEGGAITTNNDELAAELRHLRNFGFTGLDEVSSIGTNAKMSEIHAAMGLASLRTLEVILERNRKNYKEYALLLRDVPYLFLRPPSDNMQYIVLEVNLDYREEVCEHLWKHKVYARRYFYPGCHKAVPYEREEHTSLEVTERACASVLCLPTGLAVTPGDVSYVCDLIAEVLK